MNTLKKIRANQKGFTLVELIVVVAILGVLAAVAVPNYMNYLYKTRVSTDIDTARAVINAARSLYMTTGTMPTVTEVLTDTDMTNTKSATGNGTNGTIAELITTPDNASQFTDDPTKGITVTIDFGPKAGKFGAAASGTTGTETIEIAENNPLPVPAKLANGSCS